MIDHVDHLLSVVILVALGFAALNLSLMMQELRKYLQIKRLDILSQHAPDWIENVGRLGAKVKP